MRHKLFRTDIGTAIVLWCVLLLCAIDVQAQTVKPCAPLVSGTYSATVPYQASVCTISMTALPPELAIGTLNCPGAPAPGSVAAMAPLTPNAEGVCTLSMQIRTGGVLIAQEGEDVYAATNGGWTQYGIADPTAACQATDHWHSLINTEPAVAVLVSERPDGGYLFRCEVTGDHPAGFPLTTQSGDFLIYLVTVAEPVYLDGSLTIEATGEAVPEWGSVDSMTTPDARVLVGRGVHAVGTVTIQRGELPY